MSKTDRFLFRHNAIKHPACMLTLLPRATFNHTGPLTGQNTRAGPCKGLAGVAQVESVSPHGTRNTAGVKAYADVHTYRRNIHTCHHIIPVCTCTYTTSYHMSSPGNKIECTADLQISFTRHRLSAGRT